MFIFQIAVCGDLLSRVPFRLRVFGVRIFYGKTYSYKKTAFEDISKSLTTFNANLFYVIAPCTNDIKMAANELTTTFL